MTTAIARVQPVCLTNTYSASGGRWPSNQGVQAVLPVGCYQYHSYLPSPLITITQRERCIMH